MHSLLNSTEQARIHETQAVTPKMDLDYHSGKGMELAPSNDPKFAFLLKPRWDLKSTEGPRSSSAPKESIAEAWQPHQDPVQMVLCM